MPHKDFLKIHKGIVEETPESSLKYSLKKQTFQQEV